MNAEEVADAIASLEQEQARDHAYWTSENAKLKERLDKLEQVVGALAFLNVVGGSRLP